MSAERNDVELLSKLADQYSERGRVSPRECWADILKAHTLYNACASRSSVKKWREKAFEVQKTYWGGDVSSTPIEQTEITRGFQAQLYTIRDESKDDMSPVTDLINRWDCTTDNLDSTYNEDVTRQLCRGMKSLSLAANAKMKVFAGKVIQRSVELCLKRTPCKFAAVALGSMAKGEATPYSDLEFMFLLEKKTPEIVDYFETLAMTVYFLIGNLQETKLKYMNIAELKEFKDKGKNGFKIDGLQTKAGNIPTGNGTEEQKNKFILTLDELLNKYQHIFLNPDPEDSKKGDFTSMLAHTTVIYGEQSLLSEFERRRHLMEVNDARMNAHNSMIKQDVEDYDFLPLTDLTLNNHRANLKSAIYRFPSLLTYNLKIIYNIESKTSWETLNNLYQMKKLSQSFYFSLRFLLASALYIRLAAYLHHNSQNDDMTFVPTSNTSDKSHYWHVSKPLYLHMSLHMIPFKQTIADSNNLLDDVKSEIVFDTNVVSCHLNFHAGNHEEALKVLQTLTKKSFEELNMLSHCYHSLGQWNKHQQAIQSEIDYIKARPLNPALTSKLPGIKCNSAAGYANSGDLVSAKKGFEELLSELPQHLCYNYEIYAQASYFYSKISDEAKSRAFYGMAYAHLEDVAPRIGQSMYDTSRSRMLHNRANELIASLRYTEAKPLVLQNIKMLKNMYGENGICIQLAHSYNTLGNLYTGLRQYSKSLEYQQKAKGLLKSINSGDLLQTNLSHQDIDFALVYYGLGNLEKTLEHFLKALDQRKKYYPPNHPKIGDVKRRVGFILTRQRKYVKAELFLKESLAIYNSLGSALYNHGLANCYTAFGYLYLCVLRRRESLNHLYKAISLECKRDHIQHRDTVSVAWALIGKNLMAEGKYEDAAASFAKSVKIKHKQSHNRNESQAENYSHLGQCYRLCSQHKETSERSVFCSKAHRAFVDAIAALNNASSSKTDYIVVYIRIAAEIFVNWGIWLWAYRNPSCI